MAKNTKENDSRCEKQYNIKAAAAMKVERAKEGEPDEQQSEGLEQHPQKATLHFADARAQLAVDQGIDDPPLDSPATESVDTISATEGAAAPAFSRQGGHCFKKSDCTLT